MVRPPSGTSLRPALHGAILVAAMVLPGPRVAAQPSDSLITIDDYQRMNPIVTERLLTDLGPRIAAATFDVRVRIDLGPLFRPRYLDGDGVATWVDVPEAGGPLLISPWGWLSQAETIEVRVGDEWRTATVAHASAFFDLVQLQVAPIEAEPLPLAPGNVPPGTAFLASPAGPGRDPNAAPGVLGGRAPAELAHYRESSFPGRNGFAMVDSSGALVAITSINDPTGRPGTLVLEAATIREWVIAWPRIRDDSPFGLDVEIQRETMQLQTGREVLRNSQR